MSQSPRAASNNSQGGPKHKHSQKEIAKVIKHLDDRIQQLRDQILPKQPYLITLPSDVPYRKHSHDPNTWWLETPFSRDEEQLQYMSFLTHDGEDEQLLKAEGEWADESGNMLAWESSPQTDYTSRPNTPVPPAETGGPRKKISLKDYKTKDKSRVNTPERKTGSEDLRKEHFKSKVDIEKMPATLHKDSKTELKASEIPQSDKLRAKAKDNLHLERAKSPLALKDESPPPPKRRKLSSENPLTRKKDEHTSERAKPGKSEQSKPLPTLLSPTIPSNEQRRQQRALPDLLLPNLPPGLDKALSTSHRSDEVRSILKAGIGSPNATAEKKSAARSPPREVSESVERARSNSQLSVPAPNAIATKSLPPNTKSAPIVENRGTTPAASPRPRQKHIIILKYGKKNRKRVEMLLRFNQRPKKSIGQDDNKTQASKPMQHDAIKTEKKRATDTPSEQPAKKPKPSEPVPEVSAKIERPSTPVGKVDGRSPAMSATKMKSNFSTPKKDLKSAAMQRVASTDTTEARTPRGDIGKTSTPLNSAHIAAQKLSPGPSSNPVKAEDRSIWLEMNEKYFSIGRGLKREGSKLASDNNGKEHALSVVLLTEALLCFMINSGAQSHARPNVDPGWNSIIPYHIMVFKQSRRYRHLHGLVVQLGAIVRQHIQNEDIKRLARDPLPDDQSAGSAPTPGSDGTTRTNDDPERYKRRYIDFRDGLVQNAKELQTAWLDGSRLLSLDVLEREYPKTWKARARDASKRFPDKLNPKALKKDFYLPLDVTTNVFEATNFAMAFLREWTSVEGLTWKQKIDV